MTITGETKLWVLHLAREGFDPEKFFTASPNELTNVASPTAHKEWLDLTIAVPYEKAFRGQFTTWKSEGRHILVSDFPADETTS